MKPIHVYVLLTVSFLLFSISIYLQPNSVPETKAFDKHKASEGRLVFQKYNCQACHQFYGLGGYLGPDLTNVYSRMKGNETILKALFKGGMKQMPAFNLSKTEEENLIEFLKSTDASGSSDPRDFKLLNNGMIEQHGKH